MTTFWQLFDNFLTTFFYFDCASQLWQQILWNKYYIRCAYFTPNCTWSLNYSVLVNYLFFTRCNVVGTWSREYQLSFSSPYSYSTFWQLFDIFWQLFDNFLTTFWQLFDFFFILIGVASCCNKYYGTNFISAVPTSLLIAPGLRTIQFLLILIFVFLSLLLSIAIYRLQVTTFLTLAWVAYGRRHHTSPDAG
jgi:hypothetical protein